MKFTDVSQLKIVYMGTPEISAFVLTKLIEAGFNIVALVSNEDKLVGRKKILTNTPTKEVALKHNIPVYQPKKIRLENDFLKQIDFDILVTMAYGQIVPQEVLNSPKIGSLNLHGSLLPDLRGAAPIQRAIINGYSKTGVTLQEMALKMDAGKIYAQKEIIIEENDNYTSLSIKVAETSADLLINNILSYANKENLGIEQDEEKVTFANKIAPEDEHLKISMPSKDFINNVRGLSLIPGGYLFLEERKLKIFSASIVNNDVTYSIGTLFKYNKCLCLQLCDGVISLDSVQLEGKNIIKGKDFLNGNSTSLGKILS